MFKKTILILSIFLASFLQATIVEIHEIDDVRPYITENALYLFDIDDTLIDNPLYLGSIPWRNWVKSKLSHYRTNFALFDALTFFIAKNAHYKPVESSTASLIADLQNQGHAVFAFTARGRSQWYTTDIEGIDQFTHQQLHHAGIDFKNTRVPEGLQSLEAKHFYDGVIFAEHIKKGDLLKHLFKSLTYKPSVLLFIDDRLEQVQSVEAAMKEVGIPFMGFWYRRSESDRKNFDPMIANIQLEALLLQGEIIHDDRALELAKTTQQDPETYFKEVLEKADLEQLSPCLNLIR